MDEGDMQRAQRRAEQLAQEAHERREIERKAREDAAKHGNPEND